MVRRSTVSSPGLRYPALLRQELAAALPGPALREMERIKKRRAFGEGELLFGQGAPARQVLEVVSGSIRLWMHHPRKPELYLREAGPGELLGLCETMAGGRYTFNAMATAAGEVELIEREELLKLLARRYEIALAITRVMSTHLTQTHELLREMDRARSRARPAAVRLPR